jgi:flagellar hook-associated protein 2
MSATIFAGNSRYASDFQTVVDRAVAIASLPIKQLQTERGRLDSEATAWSTIDARFSALQSSFDSISRATGPAGYQVSNSNAAAVTARLGSQPSAGYYSIEVLSTGRRTTTISSDALPRVVDPATQNISSSGDFTLTVDGTNYLLGTANGSLSGLAAQINQSGAPVVATIINYGSASAPEYRLAVQGTRLGNVAISLSDGSQVLVSTVAAGFSATYRVNSVPPVPIQADSRNVSIGPGLDIELRDVGAADIEITRSSAPVGDALADLVANYNAAVDELDKHRGPAGGALAGQSLVASLGQLLRKIGSYAGTGDVRSLADVGLTLNQFGKLELDRSKFDQVAAADLDGVLEFLTGPGGQSGFVKAASDTIEQLQDVDGGELRNTIDLVKSQLKNQDLLIAENENRVGVVRDNLLAQMGAADALIASLEQQVNYFNGLFEAMRSNNK